MKTSRVEPICCMRTDRRTDMTKLIDPFRSFEKGSEKAKQKRSYWETGTLFVFSTVEFISVNLQVTPEMSCK